MKLFRKIIDRILSIPYKIIDKVILFKYIYQLVNQRSVLLDDIVDRENTFYPKKVILERKYIGTGLSDVITQANIVYWDKKRNKEGYIPDRIMEKLIPIIEKSLIEYYGENRRQD